MKNTKTNAIAIVKIVSLALVIILIKTENYIKLFIYNIVIK